MKKSLILLLLMLSAPITCMAQSARKCDQMPVKYSALSWVAQNITMHGIPTWIAELQITGSSADVERSVHDYWQSHAIPAHGNTSNGLVTVQALDQDCLYLLQMPDSPKSTQVHAFYTAMSMKAPTGGAKAFGDIPMPGSVDLLDMQSVDRFSVAKTAQFNVAGTPNSAGRAYQDTLQHSGWQVQGAIPIQDAKKREAFVLSARKGQVAVDATFLSTGAGTQALVNVSQPR